MSEKHPVFEWKKKIEDGGAEQVEGVSGIDIEVSTKISALVEGLLELFVNDPKFADKDPEQIAKAVYQGISQNGLTEQNLVSYAKAVKK